MICKKNKSANTPACSGESSHPPKLPPPEKTGKRAEDPERKSFTTLRHGHFKNGKMSPTYSSWVSMKRRTTKPNHKDWPRYGAVGIKLCKRWHDFVNFLNDVGLRPDLEHSIDRIDNSKGYEPGNCRWATRSQQQCNKNKTKLITYNGESLTVVQWARKLGRPKCAVAQRIANGMDPIEAITRPWKVFQKKQPQTQGTQV